MRRNRSRDIINNKHSGPFFTFISNATPTEDRIAVSVKDTIHAVDTLLLVPEILCCIRIGTQINTKSIACYSEERLDKGVPTGPYVVTA